MFFWKFQAFRKFSPPPGFSTFFQFGYDQNLETASSNRVQGLSLMNDVDQESKCGAVTTFLITNPEIAWNSGSYFDLMSWKTTPTKIPSKGQTLQYGCFASDWKPWKFHAASLYCNRNSMWLKAISIACTTRHVRWSCLAFPVFTGG